VVIAVRVKADGERELLRARPDQVDAGLIARYYRAHRPRAWTLFGRAQGEVQAPYRRLEALEGMW
jgi:hypothetical protein